MRSQLSENLGRESFRHQGHTPGAESCIDQMERRKDGRVLGAEMERWRGSRSCCFTLQALEGVWVLSWEQRDDPGEFEAGECVIQYNFIFHELTLVALRSVG